MSALVVGMCNALLEYNITYVKYSGGEMSGVCGEYVDRLRDDSEKTDNLKLVIRVFERCCGMDVDFIEFVDDTDTLHSTPPYVKVCKKHREVVIDAGEQEGKVDVLIRNEKKHYHKMYFDVWYELGVSEAEIYLQTGNEPNLPDF